MTQKKQVLCDLQVLFSDIQLSNSRGQESLVCFGKINNGEVFISPVVCLDAKPLNAVIYNRFVSSESAQCFLDYEREIEVLYSHL